MKVKLFLLAIVACFFYSCDNNEMSDGLEVAVAESSIETKTLYTKEYFENKYPDAIWLNDSLVVPIEVRVFEEEEVLDPNYQVIDTANIIPMSPEVLQGFNSSELNPSSMLVKNTTPTIFESVISPRYTKKDYPVIYNDYCKGRGQFPGNYGQFSVTFTSTGANLIGIRPMTPVLCIKRSYRWEVYGTRYPVYVGTNEYDRTTIVKLFGRDSPQCGIVDPIIYPNVNNPREGVASVVRGHDWEVVQTDQYHETLKMTTYLLETQMYHNGGKVQKWYPCVLDELRYNWGMITDHNVNNE